ncbi:MAG: antitoxin [Elusimicrobia bacterium]|nr:antitoxin [Elusimicrobiota bacterium]
MSKLEKEEQDILRSYEAGEWTPLGKKADLGRYQKYARATFQKDRRVNIRISSKDLAGAQKKAMEEGIPYQTLISSVIHKYVAGVLVSKRA